MTESEFDELFERAEAEGYGQRLAAEYPEWRHKQRTVRGFAMATMIMAAIALPLFTIQFNQPRDFEKVYCNKGGTTDAQWASLASEMLMEL